MSGSSVMTGGDGTYSYAKNSCVQRHALGIAMESTTKALTEAFDVKSMMSGGSSKLFTVADLGCSVGPNTFFAMEAILDAVAKKCQAEGFDSKSLEFQVLFSDQKTNDFNTLFASLPDQTNYFVAAVPGSFYGKLFPTSSIHIVYSSSALHWMSQTPKELTDEKSPAWNKGRIHYTDAPEEVVKAYIDQFDRDVEAFFRERAREVAPGGLVVAMMPGVPDGVLKHEAGISITFLGSILMEMVKEGVLDQHKVDSFNFPHVYPSAKDITRLVEKNGCFKIVRMELMKNVFVNNEMAAAMDLESVVRHLRAFSEMVFRSHFGSEIVEQLFTRVFQQKEKLDHVVLSEGIDAGGQLFAVLQRK